MILARLLAPDQFGLMALVIAAGGLFEVITEVGVRQSVVQSKRGDSPEFLNVAWWFSAVRGVVLYLGGIAVAPLLAAFFGEPALTDLLKISFLAVLFAGLTSPRLYVLEKHLQFGRYVWIVQGSGLAGTVISLLMALLCPNVWALVAGAVAEAGFRCLGSFVVCPIRPRLQLDRDCRRELFGFASGILGLPLLAFVAMKADVFVLGKVVSAEALGLYSMALALAEIPSTVYTRVALPMILPVLSSCHDRVEQFRAAILKIMSVILALGLPLAVCLAILSKPLLVMVYGDRYAPMALTFGVLGFYYLVFMLSTVIMSAYLALGRPGVHRQFSVFRALLIALMLYPAARWFGALGVAAAMLTCLLVASIVQLHNLNRIVGIRFRDYLTMAWHGLAAGLVAAPLGILAHICCRASPALETVMGAVVCAVIWIATVRGPLAVRSTRFGSKLGCAGQEP